MSHSRCWVPCKHSPVSTKWSSTWLIARPQGFPSTESFPQLKIKQTWSSVPVPSQNPSRDRSLLFLSCCPLPAVTKTSPWAISRHRIDAAFLLSELRAAWCWSPARLRGHRALSRCWSTAQLLRHLCLLPILVSLLFVGAIAGSIQWWPQNINRSNILSVSKAENWEGCCQSRQVAAILLRKPCCC